MKQRLIGVCILVLMMAVSHTILAQVKDATSEPSKIEKYMAQKEFYGNMTNDQMKAAINYLFEKNLECGASADNLYLGMEDVMNQVSMGYASSGGFGVPECCATCKNQNLGPEVYWCRCCNQGTTDPKPYVPDLKEIETAN